MELSTLQSNNLIYPWKKVNPGDFHLLELNKTDSEFMFVHDMFHKTLSKEIKKITQIQNKDLFKNYHNKIKAVLEEKEKKKLMITEDEKKEIFLWHGSRSTDPLSLIDNYSSALSTQFAERGMWGNGIYFPENASYSDDYAFKRNCGIKCLLLCKVFVGNAIELVSDSNLKVPPYKDQVKKIRYDSVKGKTAPWSK